MKDGMIPRERVGEAVRSLRQSWLDHGWAGSFAEINAGSCEVFADEVVDRLLEDLPARPANAPERLDIVAFIAVDPETDCAYDDGGPFDRALLAEHWPDIVPPPGLDWDDMDRLSADAGFSAGTHSFVALDGRFYDAEAPDGVGSVFELPFFERVIESWKSARAPGL